MADTIHVAIFNTLADMQAQVGNAGGAYLLLGRNSINDGQGGPFIWDATSTETESLTYLAIVKVTGVTTGRYKKAFLNQVILPHGILSFAGGLKIFNSTASYTTDSSSLCTINLTYENTSGGTAIFTDIWYNIAQPTTTASAANDIVISQVNAVGASNKTTTHIFARGNSSLISVLGLTIAGFRNAVTGTSVRFLVMGV